MLVVVSLLVLLLSMDISLLFVSFQGFISKTAMYGNFFGCSMYGNVFRVCCFTKHRAPPVEPSVFLSKNGTYIFFESTIALFYQPLCCGSPRGTMNLCYRIWLTEFSHSFDYKFLSIIAICKEIQTWKYILQSLYNLLHVLDLSGMRQEYLL